MEGGQIISKLPFQLGKILTTRGAVDLLTSNETIQLLSRHASGDWGDMCLEDKELNDQALASGDGRLFSSYNIPNGKVWIITEHDRSSTTVLLPEEY